jgi:hypothetical protein
MKTILCLFFLDAFIIFYTSPISGQIIMSDYDSIAVTKPGINIPVYKFFYKGDQEIQHGQTNAILVHYKTNPIFRDIGNGVLTAITGIGFTTTTDGNWKVTSTVTCNDLRPDWIVNLFCEGRLDKNRERVTNEDGSRSVETEEVAIYYWDKNANGILIERNDTIGFFSIIMNPCENKLLESWCYDILPVYQARKNNKSGIKLDVFWKPSPGNDYGIIGKLHDRDFILLRNGNNRKIWIVTDNIRRCLFQADLNYPGISKKYRIQPYFLIDPNISDQDRSDIFRLTMVGKILNNSIDSN